MTDEPTTTRAADVEPGPVGEQISDQRAERDARSQLTSQLDLDRIERDLAGVEAALGRLDDGTYWTDEVTGEPIDDAVLAADPVARRAR